MAEGLEGVSDKVAEQVGKIATDTQANPIKDPAQADVDVFQKAMQGGSGPDGTGLGGAYTSLSGAVRDPSLVGVRGVPPKDEARLGDAILEGLRKASDGYDSQVNRIKVDISNVKGNPDDYSSPVKLLKLQYDLMQFGLHTQVASKIANKVSQGIQTLFKNQ